MRSLRALPDYQGLHAAERYSRRVVQLGLNPSMSRIFYAGFQAGRYRSSWIEHPPSPLVEDTYIVEFLSGDYPWVGIASWYPDIGWSNSSPILRYQRLPRGLGIIRANTTIKSK